MTTMMRMGGDRREGTRSRVGRQLPETGNETKQDLTMNENKTNADLTAETSQLPELSISLITGKAVSLTPLTAWREGTNLRKAERMHPIEVRAWLYREVAKLCKDIDANKTLSTDEQLQFTCRAIIDDFPAIKLEEVRVAFDMLRMGKFGKLYERLKTAEIIESLRRFEGEVRTEILETHHHNVKVSPTFEDAMKRFKLDVDSVDTSPQQNSGEGLGTRLKKQLG